MNKIIAAVAAFLLPFSAQAQMSADDLCAPYPNFEVTVEPLFEEPAMDFNAGLKEIQTLARNTRNTIPRYDAVTLGLTIYKPTFNFEVPLLKAQISDGSYCARVSFMRVLVGYNDVKVLIADEFKRDSCAFKHVFEHEMKHISVNREVLNEYVPIIKERLSDYLKLYGMFIVPNPDHAEKLLRENVENILRQAAEEIFNENMRRQRLVDSPEEYARSNTACGGDIARTVRDFMGR